MQLPLQTLLVALIVIVSAVVATWRLAPARAKLRLLDRLQPDTAHAWGRWIARLRKGVAEQLMHGCSACSRASDAPALRTGNAGEPRR
jgi:hypothetical protein